MGHQIGVYHCAQSGCHACLLARIGQIHTCPWRGSGELKEVSHIFCCTIEPISSVVKAIGYLDQQSGESGFVVFHVCDELQLEIIGEKLCWLISPKVSLRPRFILA